ncbi:nuclear pore complex protein Nup153-like [Sitodiplosis mosellana]|uniref:nuclear pore complex protein Nup153-like n=1 Tax=Sitodiplosis mosellana TaxID=263140 RepID=UPI00244539B1|nr:nuclear pore complex protein Nup153-like [Sitodiplosis mosellana]XP_055303336.1 nuclear pore complex protein Nup153-like [Sitodiplosis mosellana]XP_055303337.1 nuclear pore complex protein Nup153-like [Sitodiplosis mosellana]
MDENDAPQNRSNDDAELSKSSDEHSFIGKMKFGVSKILPNSLSKWLSPKVDATTARRRRYNEIDSDEDGGTRDGSPSVTVTDSRYQTTPQLAAPPPNKKKKTFTDFLSRNTPDLYTSTATAATTPLIGERSNIVSSTLIEDVPHRTDNQFNRYLPLENGQHAIVTSHTFAEDSPQDDRYNDEASSSQSREKPTNPFTINNDSSVVNFSAHLQRAKSLFTNRSYVSPRLKNYRIRNPRSSLYRSTSSLCDNNSVSSNASSAMSSPFYNGQTTFGGASATSRRMTLNQQDFPMHHRPKVPTNLVTSRSTSSLNTIGVGGASSTSMSTTAKRILDVMSKYNTPLTEVRRISNALPSIAESSVLNKHKSILELETTANELDKSKRTLLKPNTPYNRPFGRNPVESVLTTELHVPSMPELLQLKKFATNTMKIRDIASQSDSILNKPVARKETAAAPVRTIDFRFTKAVSNRDGDLDASNNNKFVNNKNDAISNSANDTTKEHKNKIRSNLTKRKMGKCADDDAMPEPVDLPNIPLVMDKKAEIKFSEPFKLQNTEKTGGPTTDNGLQIPFKFKSSNTNTPVAPATTKEKRTNGNDTEIIPKRFEISPTKPAVSTTPATSFNARPTSSPIADFTFKPQPAINNSRASATYRFTEPILIKSASNSFEQHNKLGSNKSAYKFSEPTFITDKPAGNVAKTDTQKSLANLKLGSKPIKGVSSDSGIETTQSFGSNANKSTGLFATKPSFGTSTDNGFSAGKTVSSLSTQLQDDDTFKSLVVKQKQGKWECKDCLVSNVATASKCVCGGSAPQKGDAPVKAAQSQPAAAAVDDVFKSIVAKQKQSKWECNDCMTSNDQAQSKCACCGAANPNAAPSSVTDSKAAAPPKPTTTFSFGSLPSSSTKSSMPASSKPVVSVFKAIVDKQKSTWECSACLSANDMSKSKCCCCEQSRDVTKGATTSGAVPEKPQFSFGTGASFAPKSTFSFGSNLASGSSAITTAAPATVSAAPTFSFGTGAAKTTPSAQFSFGTLKAPESTPTVASSNGKTEDKAKEPVQKTPVSFGNATTLPSTSKMETKPEPAAAAQVAADNIFKSIVEKQKNSSWECSLCLSKNSNDIEKCVCCETPKEGTASKDNSMKEFGSLASSQKFSFGSPSGGSTFSFGSKPENKPGFQFGSAASSTTATATATSTVTSTTSSIFGSSSTQTPTFKPTTTESAAPSQSAALAGFKFGFGSSSSTNAPIFGSKIASKDETDTGPSAITNSDKGVTVLENVLIKPSTNGPTDAPTKPLFSFGQSVTTSTTDDTVPKAQKRSNTDQADNNILNKFPATTTSSNAPFVFGQPQKPNNTFSAIASSSPTTNISQESNTATATAVTAQKPTFAFGMGKSATSAFPTAQPTFGNPNAANTTFAFTASNTAATTTAASPFGAPAAAPAPSQPVFGSNAFSSQSPASMPTLGGFKAGPTFGSSGPVFGTPSPNTEAQPQATPSATSGIFQFGTGAPPSSEQQPQRGGFNFSLNTPPTFNFTEQTPQQPNVPFQFGGAPDVPNIFSAQPSANATAIQQRKKLRPVRRINRP